MTAAQWILIALVCGSIEIFTMGFWFLWFALAALLVAVGVQVNWVNTLQLQLLFFALFSIIFIIFTRPLALKLFKSNDTISNVTALIGQHGIATSNISALNYGQVKVNGEIWTAISSNDIEVNTRILVTGIDGVKLQVEMAHES